MNILALATVLIVSQVSVSQKAARERLGHVTFFDKSIMSLQGTFCCADCHKPGKKSGYSDNYKIAVGAVGQQGTGLGLIGIRNTKSLLNLYSRKDDALDWDGRVQGIYSQCFQAVQDPLVLGMPSVDAMVARAIPKEKYQELCYLGYTTPVNVINGINNYVDEARLRDGMVYFLCTLRYDNLPADKLAAGIPVILPDSCLRGAKVFEQHCAVCHQSDNNWEDLQFHNIGIAARSFSTDIGRGAITGNAADNFKFRTPTMRGVPHSPPYMHDGSMQNIHEVVGYFANGGAFINPITKTVQRDPNIDPLVAQIKLDTQEASDLESYVTFCFQDDEKYPLREAPK